MFRLALKWVSIFVIGIMLSCIVWYVGKQLNYRISYEKLVQETVREMVAEEYLEIVE